jgi:hypothetical protein
VRLFDFWGRLDPAPTSDEATMTFYHILIGATALLQEPEFRRDCVTTSAS